MSTPPSYGNPQEGYQGGGYKGGGYPPPPGGYQGGGYPPLPPRRSGYVGQVTVVAILMIVQGTLVSLIGLLCMIAGPAMFSLSGSSHQAEEERVIALFGGIYILFGGLLLGTGGLNIAAGIKNLKYRSRTLGIVALCIGGLAMFTCYCAPTAIGLMIYGLIIYLNQDVSRAFEMGEQGASQDQIRKTL
jgi:hypothetical protein